MFFSAKMFLGINPLKFSAATILCCMYGNHWDVATACSLLMVAIAFTFNSGFLLAVLDKEFCF